MKSRFTVSRAAAGGLLTSVAFFAAVWIVVHRVRPVRWTNDAELVALTSEREQFQASDDQTRDALRGQKGRLLRDAWDDAALATLQATLGREWRWEPLPASAAALERRFKLTAPSPTLRQWPACSRLVDTIEKRPGAVVESLDVAVGGRGDQRRFERLTLVVRFVWLERRSPGNPDRGAALFPRSRFRGVEAGTAEAVRAFVPALPPASFAAARPRRLTSRLRSGFDARTASDSGRRSLAGSKVVSASRGNAELGTTLPPRSPFPGLIAGTADDMCGSGRALRPPSVSAAARPRRLRLPARLRLAPCAAHLVGVGRLSLSI